MQRLEYAPRLKRDIAELAPDPLPYKRADGMITARMQADNVLANMDDLLGEEVVPLLPQTARVATEPKLAQPRSLPRTDYIYIPSMPRKKDIFVSVTEKETKPQKEFFYTKEWVQAEVAKVKQTPQRRDETPWWHLKGTGFWVGEQIKQLVKNLKGVGEDVFPDVLELELSKVGEDFAHFEQEYMLQMATLKWNLAWQDRDGTRRVICPDYKGGGKDKEGVLWSSVTSHDERDGIVFSTLFGSEEQEKTGSGGVEGWLKNARPGSFAFVISPEGWSGFDGITYPESQCYAIQVMPDGSLKAHTFRYDATVEQNEALQKEVGLKIPKAANLRERIKNTLANVALLTPEDAERFNIHGFEDFIALMQKSVGGREVAYGKGGGVKTFDEIRAFVRNPEQFYQQHEMTQKLTERFKEYARWRLAQNDSWDVKTMDLEIAMAFSPLHLNKAYDMESKFEVSRPEHGSVSGGISSNSRAENALIHQALVPGNFNYEKEKSELEKKPGCAGGGLERNGDSRYAISSKYVLSMGAPRLGKKESEEDKPEWFSCSECGWQASGAIGDNPCGGCGFTKEEYMKKYGFAC